MTLKVYEVNFEISIFSNSLNFNNNRVVCVFACACACACVSVRVCICVCVCVCMYCVVSSERAPEIERRGKRAKS